MRGCHSCIAADCNRLNSVWRGAAQSKAKRACVSIALYGQLAHRPRADVAGASPFASERVCGREAGAAGDTGKA